MVFIRDCIWFVFMKRFCIIKLVLYEERGLVFMCLFKKKKKNLGDGVRMWLKNWDCEVIVC